MKTDKLIILIFIILHSYLAVPESLAGLNEDSGARPAVSSSEESFKKGYELFEKARYSKASSYFYDYLRNHSPGDPDYDWAEFFLGISLKKVGLSQASVDLLSHLVKRKPDPKIVTYVLELFEQVTRSGPFDRELLIQEVISGQEYGFVGSDLAGFIHYYQGLHDWEKGFFEWGSDHFNQIDQYSYYYYKSLYQKALLHIYENRIDDAIVILKEILTGRNDDEKLNSEVRKTLARLLYEKGMFEEAIMFYEEIEQPISRQAGNLLERAWSQLRIGNPEKAMGLLYAYSAPGFEQYFTPEFYLLKSLIYKSACHYNSALSVVSEFRTRYADSLNLIYSRMRPVDDQTLLLVLLNEKKVKEEWEFIKLLEEEKELIRFDDLELNSYLDRIYMLRLEKSVKNFGKLFKKSYEKAADRLLQYEEKAALMEYEIGLDMSQRIYQFHYDEDPGSGDKKSLQRVAVFPFQGEFWNDELADYRVSLPDKCANLEEWDIFFN